MTEENKRLNNVTKFFNNIEIDEQILERINKLETETKHSPQLDLNRQVEDLLWGTPDYKHFERSRTEFPMLSENFYKEDTFTFEANKTVSPNLDAKCSRLTPKVFEVERLTKQQRAEIILQSFLSKDSASHSSNDSSQRFGKRCRIDDKLKEIELTERHSDTTMDRSNLSFAIQNGAGQEFVHCDIIEEIDDLLSGKKVEQDYYSPMNILNGVVLPGLSNDSAWEDESDCDLNVAEGLWFDEEDWDWEAREHENNMMFI